MAEILCTWTQQIIQCVRDLVEGFFLVAREGGKREDNILLNLSHAQGAHETGGQFIGHVPSPAC
jgi:hypothetical protein